MTDMYLPIKIGSKVRDWNDNVGRVVSRKETGYFTYIYRCIFEGEDFDPNVEVVRGCAEIRAIEDDYLEFDHQ